MALVVNVGPGIIENIKLKMLNLVYPLPEPGQFIEDAKKLGITPKQLGTWILNLRVQMNYLENYSKIILFRLMENTTNLCLRNSAGWF